jgi:hypothetical protein
LHRYEFAYPKLPSLDPVDTDKNGVDAFSGEDLGDVNVIWYPHRRWPSSAERHIWEEDIGLDMLLAQRGFPVDGGHRTGPRAFEVHSASRIEVSACEVHASVLRALRKSSMCPRACLITALDEHDRTFGRLSFAIAQ